MVTGFKGIRKKIEKNDPSVEREIFGNAVGIIYTAGFSSQTAERYSHKLTKRFGMNLQKIIELGEEGLAKEIGMGNRKNKKIVELCKFVVSVRARREKSAPFCYWVKMLHEGKNVFSLGPKSDEDFLKCLGYLEHFPVDTLTARFFDRIGLLRYAAKKYDVVINPLGTERYERLRKLMMKVYLEAGDKVFKINSKDHKVKDNLGLVDILVWLHCNENKEYAEESVCKGRKPLCEKCNLNKLCEFHKQSALA